MAKPRHTVAILDQIVLILSRHELGVIRHAHMGYALLS